VGVEQAWMADLEDEEEPEPDLEYWDDDELTPQELTAWQDTMQAAEQADRARRGPDPAACGPDGAVPADEGNLPDLIVAAVTAGGDPALMTDAELIESLAGWHAVAARAAGRELRATEELLRRRRPRVWDRRADRAESRREELDGADGGQPDGPGPAGATAGPAGATAGPERVMPAVVPSREAAAEVALALTATEYSAQAHVELTANLSRRLPAAFCELDAGRVDLHRVKVLAEGTQFLSDHDAGRVDAMLAPGMGRWTTGELRDKIRRAVIRVDPAAAQRRARHAARKARFALYGNEDQTATAAIERMPAHLGAAVKARINAIARAARAAGMTDPMPLLEAKVATGLLLDTLPDIPPPHDSGGPDGQDGPCGGGSSPSGGPPDPGPAGPWDDGWPPDWFTGPPSPDFTPPDPGGPASASPEERPVPTPQTDVADRDVDPAGQMSWPRIPAQAGRDGPGCHGLPGWLRPRTAGRIRLTVPWRTLTGLGPEPGELSWTGPITPAQAADLAAAAATDPTCTWRLIITDDNGHATAITTLPTPPAARAGPPGLVSEVTLTIQQALAAALARHGQARDWITTALARLTTAGQNPAALAGLLANAIPAANLAAAQAAATAAADTAAGGCAHSIQATGYRVPDRLRRWLNTRDRTCRNPICRQPAPHCDQDHTLAYHRGGRTCTCNLGGLCRLHHGLKQLPGWKLSQDAQGYFTWRTPAGLTYRKEPHRYAV
jgi:hypothetical protein